MTDEWETGDGLAFARNGAFWRISIAKELPERLGPFEEIEAAKPGKIVPKGEILLAVELTKARIEFVAPETLQVIESQVDKFTNLNGSTLPQGWILTVKLRDNVFWKNDSQSF